MSTNQDEDNTYREQYAVLVEKLTVLKNILKNVKDSSQGVAYTAKLLVDDMLSDHESAGKKARLAEDFEKTAVPETPVLGGRSTPNSQRQNEERFAEISISSSKERANLRANFHQKRVSQNQNTLSAPRTHSVRRNAGPQVNLLENADLKGLFRTILTLTNKVSTNKWQLAGAWINMQSVNLGAPSASASTSVGLVSNIWDCQRDTGPFSQLKSTSTRFEIPGTQQIAVEMFQAASQYHSTEEGAAKKKLFSWYPVEYTTPSGHAVRSLLAYPLRILEDSPESKTCGVVFLYSAEPIPAEGDVNNEWWQTIHPFVSQLSLVSLTSEKLQEKEKVESAQQFRYCSDLNDLIKMIPLPPAEGTETEDADVAVHTTWLHLSSLRHQKVFQLIFKWVASMNSAEHFIAAKVLTSLTDLIANVLRRTKCDVPTPFTGLFQELVKTLWYLKVVNLPGEMWQIAHKSLEVLNSTGGGQSSLACITDEGRQNWDSPALKKLHVLPQLLIADWEKFLGSEQSHVAEYFTSHCNLAQDRPVCSGRDVYDTLGKHYQQGRSPASRNRQKVPSMDEVSKQVKELIEELVSNVDDEDITISQIMQLHRTAACDVSHEFRRSAVTGRVSSRVYRVFIPHTELEKSLLLLIETLNAMRAQNVHPLVRAYYAFSTLVYYIHAFMDGNGRTARLVGNIICMRHGYPPLIKASDKILSFEAFLGKAVYFVQHMQPH